MNGDNKFMRCLGFTLEWETGGDMINGGLNDHPADPGGLTKWGFASKFWPNEDVRNMSVERAIELYYLHYYSQPKVNELEPLGLAIAHFDSLVNHSPKTAKQFLKDSGGDWKTYMQLRKDWMGKTQKPEFVKGAIRRCVELHKYIDTVVADANT